MTKSAEPRDIELSLPYIVIILNLGVSEKWQSDREFRRGRTNALELVLKIVATDEECDRSSADRAEIPRCGSGGSYPPPFPYSEVEAALYS
jgi:hypothetical protein